MAKKLAGRGVLVPVFLLLVAGGTLVWWLLGPHDQGPSDAATNRRASLVATVRNEPRGFNRLVTRDRASNLVSLLLNEKLVRTNLATQQTEPALAEEWSRSEDGRTWTLRLRRGVRFSDGRPFTSQDVLFSLAAVYDERTGSAIADSLRINGENIAAEAPDDHTVVLSFPAPFGPGVRVLDNLPILPKHVLQPALEQGTLRETWGQTTPPGELVGLGPFVLREYRPGERLVFGRNPHYWRRDPSGAALPRLESLTLLIVPDQNAEMLQLESGEADLITGEVRPEDLGAVQRASAQGRLQVFDLGVGLDADFLWFNLVPGAMPPSKAWLQRRELRQAVSLAIDRKAFADTVYLGAAVPVAGPVTPGNHDWHDPASGTPAFDVARARQMLAAMGLTDRNGDGQLEAPDGAPARFALLTQKGHSLRERGAAFLQQDLAKVGLGVDVVTLEAPALIDRVTTGQYEAAYFGVVASDTDPASNLDFWMSGGAFHPWHPGQATPATPWEARVDELMRQQVAAADPAERRRLFAQVQQVFADELPTIHFVAPRVLVATSARVAGARPGLLQPYVLWDPASLDVKAP